MLGPTFAEQQIDGELLADAEVDDFDTKDFPKARNMHWKKFHRKLKHVRENGVSLDAISAAMASIDLPISPKYSIAVATPILSAIPGM